MEQVRSTTQAALAIPVSKTKTVLAGRARSAVTVPATAPAETPAARTGQRTEPSRWRLDAFTGRFGEISGSSSGATLTMAFRLVLEAQQRGEPVAWIAIERGVFYPPDVAATGIDLDALAVVQAGAIMPAAKAADHLLRSGAFGLVVLDCGAAVHMPLHAQSRLVGLAKKHEAAFVCLTEKEARLPSLGSLVSVRAQAERIPSKSGASEVDSDERFRCEVHAIKDKRRGPGWSHVEVCRGPDGVC